MRKPGVLFDWDGVIVDSAPQHEQSWELLAAEEGRILPKDHFKRGFGLKNSYIIPELLGWTRDPKEIERLSLKKEKLYRQCLQQTELSALPGVRGLLGNLNQTNVPCAVGSSTERLNITTALERLELTDYFSALITAEDVSRGKPNPEVFLKAAAAINCPPKFCIVVEDSEPGLQAARRAGMFALGVTTTHPASVLQSAQHTIPTLEQVSVADLANWIAQV